MDPAGGSDQNPNPSALDFQGQLLGRHDQNIKEMQAAIAELTTAFQQLISTHQAPQSASTPPAAATASPFVYQQHPSREPKIPTPAKYSGDPSGFRQFMVQCEFTFAAQPSCYSSDQNKLAFIMNLLVDSPLNWAVAYLNRLHVTERNYDRFVADFQRVFDHPAMGQTAARRLYSVRQGRRDVTAYNIEFLTLAAGTKWNDEALLTAYYHGLSPELRDELATREDSDNLNSLMKLAVKIDQRLRERRRERSFRIPSVDSYTEEAGLSLAAAGHVTATSPPSALTRADPFSTSSVDPNAMEVDAGHVTATSPPPAFSGAEPMEIGRAHLTDEERQRRFREKTCMYCGQPGHFVSTCPVKSQRSPGVRDFLVSSVHFSTSPAKFQPVVLARNGSQFETQALIDSGAEANFIDATLALQLKIPVTSVMRPRQARALDGKSIGLVTQCTAPVKLCISGNHCETISLHLINSPRAPVILGRPWLALHNPTIDWSCGKVTSWGQCCLTNCLRSAPPSPPPLSSETAPSNCSPSLSVVPPELCNLKKTFNKARATPFPPRRLYACPVNLMPDICPPRGRRRSRPHRRGSPPTRPSGVQSAVLFGVPPAASSPPVSAVQAAAPSPPESAACLVLPSASAVSLEQPSAESLVSSTPFQHPVQPERTPGGVRGRGGSCHAPTRGSFDIPDTPGSTSTPAPGSSDEDEYLEAHSDLCPLPAYQTYYQSSLG